MNCFSIAGDAADNDDARMKYYYNLTVHYEFVETFLSTILLCT